MYSYEKNIYEWHISHSEGKIKEIKILVNTTLRSLVHARGSFL